MNRYHTVFLIVTGIFVLTPTASHADDEKEIYESLPDVTIGRVFFSPEQRARLDKQRQGIFVKATSRAKGEPGRKQSVSRAAGYISSGNGPMRVYANGDFIKTSSSKPLVFPGTVKVVRGADAEEDEASDEDD